MIVRLVSFYGPFLLDAAIVGDGFFAVQTGSGERYTRAGSLRLMRRANW
ncbi:MAG: hypothetical protein WKF84_28710 [Pyrinomonadaceae bacterium]